MVSLRVTPFAVSGPSSVGARASRRPPWNKDISSSRASGEGGQSGQIETTCLMRTERRPRCSATHKVSLIRLVVIQLRILDPGPTGATLGKCR
jgi:hypothetical protein